MIIILLMMIIMIMFILYFVVWNQCFIHLCMTKGFLFCIIEFSGIEIHEIKLMIFIIQIDEFMYKIKYFIQTLSKLMTYFILAHTYI